MLHSEGICLPGAAETSIQSLLQTYPGDPEVLELEN